MQFCDVCISSYVTRSRVRNEVFVLKRVPTFLVRWLHSRSLFMTFFLRPRKKGKFVTVREKLL
jgi:hypothetical protein